jgi:hypothetical protein
MSSPDLPSSFPSVAPQKKNRLGRRKIKWWSLLFLFFNNAQYVLFNSWTWGAGAKLWLQTNGTGEVENTTRGQQALCRALIPYLHFLNHEVIFNFFFLLLLPETVGVMGLA